MDLAAVALPAVFGWAGWIATVLLIAVAAWHAPWRRLVHDAPAPVWCGGIVVLTLLWTLRTGPGALRGVHFVGIAAFTLLSGRLLALVGAAVAVPAATAIDDALWSNTGLAFLTLAVLPIAIVALLQDARARFASRPLFVRVFVEAWLGGALSVAICGGTVALLAAHAVPDWRTAFGAEAVPCLVCLACGTAMLTGMVMTLFLVHLPAVVARLEDERRVQRHRPAGAARTLPSGSVRAGTRAQVQPRSR